MRSDIEFNISFCKLIENYPALYDNQRSDYAHKGSQDIIWEKIAKKTKESENDCRERWKNIRNRYVKYVKLKSLPNPTKRIKEYYLAPHLTFLEKHLKSRPPKPQRVSRVSHVDDDSVSEDEPENSPASSLSHSQTPNNIDTVFIDSSSSRVSIKRESLSNNGNEPSFDVCFSKRLKTNKEERSEETIDTFKEYYSPTADTIDTDMAFLKSVLPDMQAMNLAQKRKFKIGIIKLAEQILEEDF